MGLIFLRFFKFICEKSCPRLDIGRGLLSAQRYQTASGELCECASEHDVCYCGEQSDKADLIYSLNAGDVHWCVNAKGIKGVSCPSKAYGIMAAAKPILGVLESGSEVRCLIEDTNGGLCCEPGEYDKVERNIYWFIDNAGLGKVKAMGARGRENLEKNLTRNVSVRKYAEEIMKL